MSGAQRQWAAVDVRGAKINKGSGAVVVRIFSACCLGLVNKGGSRE
jgi:hypothetical protein